MVFYVICTIAKEAKIRVDLFRLRELMDNFIYSFYLWISLSTQLRIKGVGILMKKSYRNGLRKCFGCVAASVMFVTSVFNPVTANALGGFNLKSSVVMNPVNEYNVDIAPGVRESRYSFQDREGKMTEAFVVEVDMDNPEVSIEAGTPNNADAYATQTVMEQAAAETYDGHVVVAAVNGDYYNMATGEPFGIVYKDGRAVKPGMFSDWRFFAITKDGKAVAGDINYYNEIRDNIKEALGCQAILVKDGKPYELPQFSTGRQPRTAAGIKADGSVFFISVDGRQEPYSSGISAEEIAQLMIDLGAVTAVDLDGGGSTTYLSRKPGYDYLQLVNRPSGSVERNVANSWLVVSKAESDHKFHSAFIEPYDKTYTPGSAVQFSFKGRDKSLASATAPSSGLKWEIGDKSYGKIDSNGKFTSSGKVGEVEVLLKQNGKTVGSTWLGIAKPDEMFFGSQQITVGRNSQKQLNLITTYNKRVINWNPNDIDWQVPKSVGTVDDNGVLHVSEFPVSGRIMAYFKGTNLRAGIDVVAGQIPETIFDFENAQYKWVASTTGRGETAIISLSSVPDGSGRFGKKALKIDFDMTEALKQTTIGVYAGPGVNVTVPGNPSSIGMWVYATPEAKGYWLRMTLIDGQGKPQYINFTTGNPGVNWTGWKYVEAKIPSGITGPFQIDGAQALRIMSTVSGETGPMTKGSIYVDNIKAVYVDSMEDLYAPVIESINIENKVYNTRAVNISAVIHEYEQDEYKTGVDWNSVRIYVDDKDYTNRKGNFACDDGTASLSGMKWTNGMHKVTISVKDNAGNESTKTSYFTVNTSSK